MAQSIFIGGAAFLPSKWQRAYLQCSIILLEAPSIVADVGSACNRDCGPSWIGQDAKHGWTLCRHSLRMTHQEISAPLRLLAPLPCAAVSAAPMLPRLLRRPLALPMPRRATCRAEWPLAAVAPPLPLPMHAQTCSGASLQRSSGHRTVDSAAAWRQLDARSLTCAGANDWNPKCGNERFAGEAVLAAASTATAYGSHRWCDGDCGALRHRCRGHRGHVCQRRQPVERQSCYRIASPPLPAPKQRRPSLRRCCMVPRVRLRCCPPCIGADPLHLSCGLLCCCGVVLWGHVDANTTQWDP